MYQKTFWKVKRLNFITLGLGFFWVAYDSIKWVVEHIQVDDRRFTFQGSFVEYIGKLVIWFVVSLITLGLGSVWVVFDWTKWVVERSALTTQARFTTNFTDFIGRAVVWVIVGVITFGIGFFWVQYDYYKWVADRIEVPA